MLNFCSVGKLQHVVMADEIGLRVGAGIFDRVADARLGGKVQHNIESLAAGSARQRVGLGDIGLHETKAGFSLKYPQSRGLELWRIIGVEIIDSGNGMPTPQQRRSRMKANESRPARQKNAHSAKGLVPKPLAFKWT